MNMDAKSALIAAFNNLAAICCHSDLSLIDLAVNDDSLTLTLSRSMPIGCGDYENEAHCVTFTWDEMTDSSQNDDPATLALLRWERAKVENDKERARHAREQAAKEAAERKRQQTAGKGARTKRELATLARLKAKYEVKA